MNFILNEQYMSSWHYGQNRMEKLSHEWKTYHFLIIHQKTLDTLNPNIILVGLNISEKIDRVFGNFHQDKTKAQDYKTRYALQDIMFWGSYMTDIIKSFKEKNSINLIKYFIKNKRFDLSL